MYSDVFHCIMKAIKLSGKESGSMLKKRFLCACALMMILISLFSPGAFALENAGSVITEELWLERDGQKIYGRPLCAPCVHAAGSPGAGRRPDGDPEGRGARV